MLINNSNYPLLNPNRHRYVYPVRYQSATSALTTFKISDFVTARADYNGGYPTTNTREIGFKITAAYATVGVASLINVQCTLNLIFDTAAFAFVGYTGGPGNIQMTPMMRTPADTTGTSNNLFNLAQPEILLLVTDPTTYTNANFQLQLYNKAGSIVNSADVLYLEYEIIEYTV